MRPIDDLLVFNTLCNEGPRGRSFDLGVFSSEWKKGRHRAALVSLWGVRKGKVLEKGVMNERSCYWNEENERLRSVDGLEIHLYDRALKAELVVLVHNLGSEAPQLVNPIEDDRRH